MKIAFPFILILALSMAGCNKGKDGLVVDPSDKLALDSLVATKKHVEVWEQIHVRAYARGENLEYTWYTNHGSMLPLDSSAVVYWACPSCEGTNIIQCTVSNEYGSISDTVIIEVDPYYGL